MVSVGKHETEETAADSGCVPEVRSDAATGSIDGTNVARIENKRTVKIATGGRCIPRVRIEAGAGSVIGRVTSVIYQRTVKVTDNIYSVPGIRSDAGAISIKWDTGIGVGIR